MLPAQKRKALAPPDSPPQAKRDRTSAAPGLPPEPPASCSHVGNAPSLLPGSLSPEEARSLSSQASEAEPAVTRLARPGSPQGPSQQPGHSIAPETPSRSDRDGLSSHEKHKGPPSDDEKDEGERNLVITVEEGESVTKKRKKKAQKREKKWKEGKGAEEMQPDCDIQLDDSFEQALEDGAKQHNLTAINVRNILHEVITNEHVVAMMKAAIFDTEQPHLFEPKMTRSKLKEVVEKGVVPPTWNISPIKSKESKAPQFIDIPLEEEDSSDEEYRPEEEEEDETAEEGFLESDAESTTSSPAGSGRPRSRQELLETEEESASLELPGATERDSGLGVAARHLSVETIPMGPPPLPPKAKHKQSRDTSFMEKLHAVDEELASNEVCMDSYQSLNDCLIAYRTRSKWPLNNVSLGLLEAELKAPDITADMYDQGTQDDVYWQNWMKALMNDLDYEDDEDDPEYNFLEDLDEPDMEDFRNDRAVQITKKEVNELMEELFETFQDEMGVLDVEEEAGDDDTQEQLHSTFNTPQAMRFEEPLANILNEQHRTVKAQIEQLRQRKAKQQVSATETKCPSRRSQQPDTLFLDQQQQRQLQQQMQQHVQLLTQVYLLTSINPSLSQEAATSKVFLKELESFAEKASEVYSAKEPDFSSMFSPCNLPEALGLIEEFDANIKPHVKVPPRKDDQKMNRRFDESNYLPKEVAWIVATRALFMYPELLPHTALQPKHPKDKAWFSKGEDNLLVLGLKHFEETDFPKPLISQYLMPPKTYHQLSVRIKNLSVSRAPDNIIKVFKKRKIVLPMPSLYTAVSAEDRKPPIEREDNKLPYWLQRSLPAICRWLELRKEEAGLSGEEPVGGTELKSTDTDTKLPEGEGDQGRQRCACSPPSPLQLPDGVLLLLKPRVSHLTKRELRRHKRRPSVGKPVLIHPAVKKTPCKQPGPLLPPKHGARPPPRLIQPAPSVPLVTQLCQPQAVPALSTNRPTPSPWLCLGSAGRKPRGRRAGRSDTRGRRPRPTIVPLPVQRAPVILTVPPGVKLLSLPSGCCNVLDVPPGQTLQLATMLVSPSAFACPVTQPVAGAPPVNGAAPTGGAPSDRHVEAEGSSSCSTSLVKEGSPGPGLKNVTLSPGPNQWTVKSEPAEDTVAGNPQESRLCAPEQPSSEAKGQEEPVGSGGTPPHPQGPAGTANQGQVILGLGQELDVDNSLDHSNEPSRQKPEPGEQMSDGGEDSPKELRHKEALPRQVPEPCRDGVEEAVTSPEDLKSHPDKADKDGLEEEDDEDFDDLTQDEEDEEVLSSASEESALSVPELQETMQKLTWLASERRLSQEGDSEEENSQEENSEPEEEEEGEGLDLKEADGVPRTMMDKEGQSAGFPTARREISTGGCLPGEGRKLSEKGKASSRSRAKRGRRRISKDTSKLLLLYDEDILNNDPLREQKDMAFAQAYLSKVREALQDVPGKYEEFLRILYDFETNPDQRTAVDLYGDLCDIIQDWPQLLKDFAAFLLPEQALQCGLFEEQQAFDKSRKFLRQLEICFAENPTHYQKIIKALQSCMVCSAPDVAELKVQVWQLLKGHHHLQDEFSLFFDSLRPPTSRMSDFEEVNWSEDKEYEFDGFEEVVLPDLEDDEEVQKLPPPSRNKKRREGHTHDKSLDSKSSKGKEPVSVPEAWSPQPGNKDPEKAGDMVEDYLEQREDSHTPDPNKTSLDLTAPSSGRSQCLPSVACGEGDPWESLQSPGPDHSLEDGDEMESAASRFKIEAPSSPAGSTNGTWSPVAEGEGNSESQGERGCSCDSSPLEWGVGGEEEADGGGAMRGTAANGFRESTCRSQGEEQARLGLANTVEPQPAHERDPHSRVAAAGEQSPQDVEKLGDGEESSRPTEENGTPSGVSQHPPRHALVKFASAGAQIRFMSCQKLSDLSPIDLRLTLACRSAPDGSFQNSGDHEPARAHTVTRDSPAVSPSLGHDSDSSLSQTESGEPSAGEGDEHYAQAAVCAQNTRLSSTGERVVLWTREADRAILTACQESGANEETFRQVAQQLNSKSSQEVSQRFRELMWLFHTSGDASTDEEEDVMSSSNTEQLSDRQVSDEEQD